ncbi:glucose 1-dehydrogenase [bacterium]|nr:glucose 1-dehydrogenase [bacterium]
MKWFKISGVFLIALVLSFFAGGYFSPVRKEAQKKGRSETCRETQTSSTPQGRVQNKVAIVTGGKQGIGYAIAQVLIQEGAYVVVTDINNELGFKAVEKLPSGKALFIQQDVSKEADWENVFKKTISWKGRVDIVVNNAGISGLTKGFGPQDPEHTSLEDFKKIQAINTEGTFLGCRFAIENMKKNGGSIVNISSRSGNVGVPTMCAYAASKAAIRSMTKSVALWCCSQNYPIRCNSVHPAAIDTPFWDPMVEGQSVEKNRQKIADEIPMGHMGEPNDVAYAVLYLASNESKFVTGAELMVDGGILASSGALPRVLETNQPPQKDTL